jgi:hypothetical protein
MSVPPSLWERAGVRDLAGENEREIVFVPTQNAEWPDARLPKPSP